LIRQRRGYVKENYGKKMNIEKWKIETAKNKIRDSEFGKSDLR